MFHIFRIVCCTLLGLCLGISGSFAAYEEEGNIRGSVLTADSLPAMAVTIQLRGTGKTTVTAMDGSFALSHIPPGTYELIVSCVGCEPLVKTINIGNERTTFISVQLKISERQLGEVVVTGQYAPQSLRNAVYHIRVISQDMIKLRNATDVLGVLRGELGIRFSTDLTLGETDVQLMGMSGENVKVLLDGVPLIDREGTKQSLSQVDINSIDRIEIVEGPMSVVYGTDALAGVINIITKKNIAKNKQLSINARVQEETAGKEYNAFSGKGTHNENAGIHWQNKNWYANGSFSRNAFGGWQGKDTGRAKEWMPKDQWLGTGMAGYRNDKVNVWYRLNYLYETLHSTGNINPNTSVATDKEYITNRYTHQLQADWRLNKKWSFNGALSYQDYARATQTTTLNTLTGDRRLALDAAAQDTSSFNTLFFRSTAQYIISPKISLQPGIEIQRDNASGQRIEGSPVINNYSFFVSSELKPWPGVNIRPGIRLSKNSTYDAPPVIPSLNTMFNLNKNLSLRLAYARGFRAPALRELYFSFFDANHSIEGNPNLKAEYSNSFNGSLSWHMVGANDLILSSSVAGFYNDFNNRIDLALGQNAANPGVYTYINISKYKTTGGTWENDIEWKQLHATLGLSYIGRYNQYTEDEDNNNELPQFLWSTEVNSNVTYTFKKAGASIALFYKYTGRMPQYESNNDGGTHLAKTAAFHWADLNINKTINRSLTLSAGVKNLFDVTRLQNTSLDVGGAHSTGGAVPMSYGRSYFIGLNFNWVKE